MVLEITDQNFEDEVLKSNLPVVVDLWALWCGPCRMIAPITEKLSKEYNGKFKFCKFNELLPSLSWNLSGTRW